MKKLTVKEIDDRIRNIEKDHNQHYIQSACHRYVNSNLEKKKALKDLADAEQRLNEAKRRLEK